MLPVNYLRQKWFCSEMNELRPVETPQMIQVGEKDAKEKKKKAADTTFHKTCGFLNIQILL